MKEEIRTLVEKYVETLSQDSRIKGVFVFGSQANGTAHEYSDIDLYVVHDGVEADEQIAFKVMNKIYLQHQWRLLEEFEVKSAMRTRGLPLGVHSKLIYDSDGHIKWCLDQSKKNLKLGPKQLDERFIENEKMTIACELNIVKGLVKYENKAGAVLVLNDIIYNIVDLHYDKKAWWFKTKKHIVEDLKTRDRALALIVENGIVENNIQEKLAIASELYQRLIKEPTMIFGKKEKNQYYFEREGVYGVFTNNGKIGVVKIDGMHFLVGGGIEKSENLLECMHREFQEEIGYSVKDICFSEKYTEYFISKKDQKHYKLIGNVFKVELDKKIAEPAETDHELVWLDYAELKGKMPLEYQAHAVETIWSRNNF